MSAVSSTTPMFFVKKVARKATAKNNRAACEFPSSIKPITFVTAKNSTTYKTVLFRNSLVRSDIICTNFTK